MSQRALAQLVGVSPTYLSKVLRRADYKTPSPELARRVALALDFPPDYFPEYREGVVIAEVKRSHDLRDRLYDELSRD